MSLIPLNQDISIRARSDTYPAGRFASIPSYCFKQQSGPRSGLHLKPWLIATLTNTSLVLPSHNGEPSRMVKPGMTTHRQPGIAAAVHSHKRLQSCVGGLQPSGKLEKEVELAVRKIALHRLWFKVGRMQHPYRVYDDTGAHANVIAESLAKTFKLDYKNSEPPYPLKPFGNTQIHAIGFAKGVQISPGCWPDDVWYEADFHVVPDHLLPEFKKRKVYIGIVAIERCDHLKRSSCAGCE